MFATGSAEADKDAYVAFAAVDVNELEPQRRSERPLLVDKLRGVRAGLLVGALLGVAAIATVVKAAAGATSGSTVLAAAHDKWHGVSLGGWLVMEINPAKRGPDSPMDLRPQWMYDQIQANSELDFVTLLRETSDDYAVQTMKNHWAGYITDDQLDAAAALGVDMVRVPVGYWIMDKPDGGTSPLEYGISPEGFVTGGLNHLKDMLIKLKARNMVALLDIHAAPCNSACVSDGLYCMLPLAFAPPGFAPIGPMPRCGGGFYPTTRKIRKGEISWGDVGVNSIAALAEWIAQLPDEASAVAAFQLANEPVLGAGDVLDSAVNAFYQRALDAARSHLPTLPLILSFMGPSSGVLNFLKEASETKGPVLADHHYYLNWQSPGGVTMPWDEIHRRACIAEAEGAAHVLEVYRGVGQKIIVGEWSLAVNHDAMFDLSDPAVVKHLSQLFKEQLHAFHDNPTVAGAFFWTLRMGSGWDPRPTEAFPNGRQLEGTSAWKSLEGYPFPVWSLLEMANAGVAAPLDSAYDGACSSLDAAKAPWFSGLTW